jgi:hypothetical protein
MTLPRDIFTGKMPRAYDSILSREGVLIPMQQAMAGNVLAHYADGSTLAGTPTSGVGFAHDGQIPRVAGGSPKAAFDDSADRIDFTVTGGDLQMSTGGTWLFLCTPEAATPQVSVLAFKSSNGAAVRQGYQCYLRPTGVMSFATSSNTAGASVLNSAINAFEFGERLCYAATLSASGEAKIYKNGNLIASRSGMSMPTDIASTLALGRTGFHLDGSQELAGFIPDVVLDVPEIQAITAQCGPLG